jgi:hypothetical protein
MHIYCIYICIWNLLFHAGSGVVFVIMLNDLRCPLLIVSSDHIHDDVYSQIQWCTVYNIVTTNAYIIYVYVYTYICIYAYIYIYIYLYVYTCIFSGTALVTSFIISTSRWAAAAENFPLSYAFTYQTAPTSPTLTLAARSLRAFVAATLPAGMLYVYMYIYIYTYEWICNMY